MHHLARRSPGYGARYEVARVLDGGSVSVPADFMGLHMHSWPQGRDGVCPTPDVPYKLYRSHDYAPSYTNGVNWRRLNPAVSDSAAAIYASATQAWQLFDSMLDAHAARGADVIYTFHGTPTWQAAAGPQGPDLYGAIGGAAPPVDLGRVATFIGALVQRANGGGTRRIRFLQIWNEPNFSGDQSMGFWWGTAAQLAALARTVYQAAKAADPGITVLSPGFNQIASISAFLNASDGAGGFGRQWVEAVAYHPYDCGVLPTEAGGGLPGVIAGVRAAMAAGGLGSAPLWHTEQGWHSTGDFGASYYHSRSDSGRADRIWRALTVASAMGVRAHVLYGWDNELALGRPCDSTNARQALQAFGDDIAGRTLTHCRIFNDGAVSATRSDGVTFTR